MFVVVLTDVLFEVDDRFYRVLFLLLSRQMCCLRWMTDFMGLCVIVLTDMLFDVDDRFYGVVCSLLS